MVLLIYIDIVERKNTPSLYTGTTYNPFGRSGGYSTEPTSYVPYLAEGAVIPPNAPFTAVLGDQRNGYNLEGPEDMFRGIVREENSEVAATMESVGEVLSGLLQNIISAMENMEIDGQAIFDIYNNQMRNYNAATGKTPATWAPTSWR